MAPSLSMTSYAVMSLLAIDTEADDGLTGYELKQRADNTLRFYWVSPAMSQIYTELDRLSARDYVRPDEDTSGGRPTKRFRITPAGREALRTWLRTSEDEFPVLKHPIALRLMLGAMMGTDEVRAMLDSYEVALAERRRDLEAVREMLGDRESVAYPARVADWGLAFFDSEATTIDRLRDSL
ncbi:MAG: helix-turn-helix transcriptional regulator [Aeromicrobium sp.]